jgi:hypothetical protein
MADDSFYKKQIPEKYTTEITTEQRQLLKNFYHANPNSPTHVHLIGNTESYKADDIFYEQLKIHNELLNFSPKKRIFKNRVTNSELRARKHYFENGGDIELHLKRYQKTETPINKLLKNILYSNIKASNIEDTPNGNNIKSTEKHYEWMVGCLDNSQNYCWKEITELKSATLYHQRRNEMRRREIKETDAKVKELIKNEEYKKSNQFPRRRSCASPLKNKPVRAKPFIKMQSDKQSNQIPNKKGICEFLKDDNPPIRRRSATPKVSSFIDKMHSKYMGDLKKKENMDLFYYKIEACSLASTLASSPLLTERKQFPSHMYKLKDGC